MIMASSIGDQLFHRTPCTNAVEQYTAIIHHRLLYTLISGDEGSIPSLDDCDWSLASVGLTSSGESSSDIISSSLTLHKKRNLLQISSIKAPNSCSNSTNTITILLNSCSLVYSSQLLLLNKAYSSQCLMKLAISTISQIYCRLKYFVECLDTNNKPISIHLHVVVFQVTKFTEPAAFTHACFQITFQKM